MFALRIACGFFACLITSVFPVTLHAGEETSFASFWSKLGLPKERGEFSNGFDVTGAAWSAYSTAIIALSGPASQDGWRLKFTGIYSSYHYDTSEAYCQLSAEEKKRRTGSNFSDICNSIANNPPQGADRDQIVAEIAPYGLALSGDQITASTPHQATRYHLGVAPGYQASFGPLIVKAYLGLAFERQDVAPPDASKSILGGYWGAEGWLEAWLSLGENVWASADSSYFTGTSAYSAAMKLGYRPVSWLTLGPELATYGDQDDVSGRAGAFLRFDAMGMETTLAGGVSGNYKDSPSAYGTANFYVRF